MHHDPRAEFFAVSLVRHTEYLNVANGGMGMKKLFDLSRAEILPAADHHVFDATDHLTIALLIEGPKSPVCIHPDESLTCRVCSGSSQ